MALPLSLQAALISCHCCNACSVQLIASEQPKDCGTVHGEAQRADGVLRSVLVVPTPSGRTERFAWKHKQIWRCDCVAIYRIMLPGYHSGKP